MCEGARATRLIAPKGAKRTNCRTGACATLPMRFIPWRAGKARVDCANNATIVATAVAAFAGRLVSEASAAKRQACNNQEKKESGLARWRPLSGHISPVGRHESTLYQHLVNCLSTERIR